jgi:hypothetical protein
MDRRLGNLTSCRFESDVTDFANLLCTQLRSIVKGYLLTLTPTLTTTCYPRARYGAFGEESEPVFCADRTALNVHEECRLST